MHGCSVGRCGVGGVYTIGTDVPLLGDFQVSIPVDAMTREAIVTAKAESRKYAPALVGGAFLLGVTSVLSGLWIARRLV